MCAKASTVQTPGRRLPFQEDPATVGWRDPLPAFWPRPTRSAKAHTSPPPRPAKQETRDEKADRTFGNSEKMCIVPDAHCRDRTTTLTQELPNVTGRVVCIKET